ncbi:TonB-dependent receptor [Caulobacter sp. UNC358MFTsu5.1]|uniref:TonB-dependent receptor n=1 Tax=Caulobacter sp. UNC358MFTsu5.1 TaxID=1449049 RepID=UPI000B1C7C15|nr:TonB-dependent receptor [Caulobacter sp. UNC358MFTsu5.1]
MTTGARNPVRRARSAHKTLLISAASALTLLGAAPALAQTAAQKDDQTVDEIVVTGQRQAAQSAQQIKKNNDLVVDSIVAEDVGKLPDNNVADALARVTGIQVRRDSGEANSVLIRGLPNLVTLLNGREVFTTTGRYIALADIPANMLQRVDVYKSAAADQIEGGIAGAIDVRTRRPFDFSGAQFNAFGHAVYSDKAEKWNPDFGATASNRWETGAGEFGALIGVSFMERDYHEERAFNVRPDPKTDCGNGTKSRTCGSFNAAHPAPQDDVQGPFVMGYIPIAGDRKRQAANFALQWRPDDTSELYFEGFVTDYKNVFELDFLVGLPWLGDGNLSATVFPGTNQLKTLTNHNVFTIMSTQANDQHSNTNQFSAGGYKELGSFKLSTDLSVTNSYFTYENPIMDTSTIVPLVQVDTSHDGTAQLNYNSPGYDITNPSAYTIENWFDNYGKQTGGSVDWRADVVYTAPSDEFIREISAGVRYADRSAESNQSYGGAAYPFTHTSVSTLPGLNGVSEPMAGGGPDYITTQWYTPSASYLLSNTDKVRAQTALLYDRNVTSAAEFALRNDPVTGKRRIDPGMYFSDVEKTYAGYVQSKIGGDMGSVPWSGVVGLRLVRTEQTLGGNNVDTATSILRYTPTTKKNSSVDLLPSANLRFDVRPDLVARLSVGRTVTRPDFAQLNPGVSLSTVASNTTFLSGSGGNPNLKPVTSDSLDTSLEWYFAPDGFLTVAYFHRNIDGYVETTSANEVINGTTYIMTRPSNSGKDKLDGVEVGYQQFYDFLPGPLSGLGLQANLTFMDGSMENGVTGVKTDFRGLSKWSYNVAVLYEKGPISGRLAYNWRQHFLDTPNFENSGFDLIADDTAQLDGSLSYKIGDKITLTLEGVNLLDTEFKDYFTDKHLYPRDTRRYDRQVLLGFRWKM